MGMERQSIPIFIEDSPAFIGEERAEKKYPHDSLEFRCTFSYIHSEIIL